MKTFHKVLATKTVKEDDGTYSVYTPISTERGFVKPLHAIVFNETLGNIDKRKPKPVSCHTFFWLGGKREVLQGDSPETCMNNAGYGQGAVRALDFWARGDNHDYVWNPETRSWDMTAEAKKRVFGK